MESTQTRIPKDEVDQIRERLTRLAEANPSINIEERLSCIIASLEETIDVVWGDTPTLSSFAMAIDDDDEADSSDEDLDEEEMD